MLRKGGKPVRAATGTGSTSSGQIELRGAPMRRTRDRSRPRWLDAIPVRASAVEARGPAVRGPTAMAPLAVAATALGAVAIGRLAIGRATIKRLVIAELEVERLRVVDLDVVSERPRPAGPAGGESDAGA